MGKQELISLINKMPDEIFIDEDGIMDFFMSLFHMGEKSNATLDEQLNEALKYSADECLDYSNVSDNLRKMLVN